MLEQQQPADVGFDARYTWTLPLVAEWIKREFGITMSVRGISAMLKRMNFSFTKATYTLAKADEEAQALIIPGVPIHPEQYISHLIREVVHHCINTSSPNLSAI
ncbi:hypothetical protein QOZ95_005380 [Paenibacillus brasilensis]|uniref:Winged helix-turn helix domain-containing protein n=2 Tax=Paenibacillus brasilensis TaxID=128574 RepID=A0ABU0L7A0_9BACL|nr:hypothetical protein [Paenibacillus brasilensis]